MRIVLFGKNGQLGWEFQRILPLFGELIATDSDSLDLARPADVRQFVREHRPDVMINASAYTAVDKAESESALAMEVNANAPALMAEEARRLGATLLHFSTDYVFDGAKNAPYTETDHPNPLNVYGLSKLRGEQAILERGGRCFIFRTSWVYSLRQAGFVSKILQWARNNSELRVVTDQVSNPTWSRMLAQAACFVLAQSFARGIAWTEQVSGLYHLASRDSASRFEWAQEILALDPAPHERRATSVLPALSAQFPLPATRPAFSALDCSHFQQTFGLKLPTWRESLSLSMKHE